MTNKNPKKEIMKEVAKLIRSILKENGYDSNGRVRLYQDLSVECLCYGNKNIQNCVVEGLKKYSNFGMDGFSYCWNEGKYIIYLTIF
jgi:hypothetical protein